jgi:peroxiredoxin
MNGRIVKTSLLVAALAAVAGLMSAPWSSSREPAVARAVSTLDGQWVGRQAPSFTLPGLDGRSHRLSDYRGKVVFLNFWASFCEPCKREMPSMERLIREYQGRGMEMIAVSLDPERADAQRFLSQFMAGRRSAMTVLWDREGQVSSDFGTELIPETYIIDRQGRVVARFVNEYDWTRPEVKKLVEALLTS